jgi:hypothetical protein
MEAIVAIFVITTGLVGVLSLVSQTIAASTFSKDKLIAAYLAQEGIEIIRNIRDTEWLKGASWGSDICTSFPCEWEADYTTTSFLNDCGSPTNYNCHLYNSSDFLKIDGSFYNYSSGNPTKFTRKITINDGPLSGSSLNIKIEVFWQEKGAQHKVEAQENLYNWKK